MIPSGVQIFAILFGGQSCAACWKSARQARGSENFPTNICLSFVGYRNGQCAAFESSSLICNLTTIHGAVFLLPPSLFIPRSIIIPRLSCPAILARKHESTRRNKRKGEEKDENSRRVAFLKKLFGEHRARAYSRCWVLSCALLGAVATLDQLNRG